MKYSCQKFSVKGGSDNNPLLALQYFFLGFKNLPFRYLFMKICYQKKWTDSTIKTKYACLYLHERRN